LPPRANQSTPWEIILYTANTVPEAVPTSEAEPQLVIPARSLAVLRTARIEPEPEGVPTSTVPIPITVSEVVPLPTPPVPEPPATPPPSA
jgi:hypothetical protein